MVPVWRRFVSEFFGETDVAFVRPGDIVSADDDGVVIVPRETIADVCVKSAAREEKEASVMKALKAGGDILELSGIGKVLESKNCTFA